MAKVGSYARLSHRLTLGGHDLLRRFECRLGDEQRLSILPLALGNHQG